MELLQEAINLQPSPHSSRSKSFSSLIFALFLVYETPKNLHQVVVTNEVIELAKKVLDLDFNLAVHGVLLLKLAGILHVQFCQHHQPDDINLAIICYRKVIFCLAPYAPAMHLHNFQETLVLFLMDAYEYSIAQGGPGI